MPAKKAAKKSDEADVKAAPKKTAAAKKKEEKGPPKYKHVSGKAHPDHNPPVTIVAEASKENAKKYEDARNAVREKQFVSADWRDLEGDEPQDESDAATPEYPAHAKEAANP